MSVTRGLSRRTIAAMKRLFFLLGIGFLGLAFLGAAVEVAARAMSRDLGWLPSIGHVWGVLSPDGFDHFLAGSPWIGWQHLVGMPAVLAFGVPGFLLIFVFRNREEGPDAEHEASLFLFDELAKHAQADDFGNPGDDTAPSDSAHLHLADPSYAEEFSANDVASEHDFLLGEKTAADTAKPQD